MKYKSKIKNSISLLILALIGLTLTHCKEDVIERPKDQEDLQMIEYIVLDSTKSYTEFYDIAEKVGMSGILSTRGPFTLFLPDNDAFNAYYQFKGKNSYNDFTDAELLQIIRNHVIAAEIATSNIGLGSLSEKNALGDYLVSEFQGSDIVINKHAKIIDRDIYVANGIIHRVDNVIDPVTQGIYSTIKELEEYSIFAKALELSGLSDTLDMNEIAYGSGTARVRYTLIAEIDSVYNANGIFTIEDLIARYDNGIGSLKDLDNNFFQYVAYHCIENTFYMSDISDGSYYVITRENFVNFKVENEFVVNPEESDTTTILMEQFSNIPTKNGVIHAINQILSIPTPEPKEYIFDNCSFPEFEALDIYRDGSSTRNFYDGENDFAKVKWTGDYMQYYAKAGGAFTNGDCIGMSEGFWSLEVTTPKIARGNYHVSGNFKEGFNRANVIMYIDGVKVGQVLELNTGELNFVTLDICDVNWTNTTEHKIKLVTVYPGVLYWDNLTFTPLQ